MTVEGVEVTAINLPDFTAQEAKNYVDFVRSKIQANLREVAVKACSDGKVDVSYYARQAHWKKGNFQ